MKTSTNNMIIALAIASSTLIAAGALAKGGNSGSGHSFSSHMNSGNSGTGSISNKYTGNTFKISTQSSSTNSIKTGKVNSSLLNGITTTNLTKTGGSNSTGIKISNLNTLKSNTKVTNTKTIANLSSKKDCKKWCNDYCFPWYFGCYSNYSCYDYCYPSYCYSRYPTYTCDYVTPLVIAAPQPGRMQVALGTVIMLNGQTFGSQPGGVRLRLNAMALPLQVIEWTPNAVKVQLPQIELPGVTPADIEVVRPDGSLASTTSVDLTIPQQVALNR